MEGKKTEIEGLTLYPLKIIGDANGSVMHMLKKSSPAFKEFGEIYFSTTNSGLIKKWRLHKVMEQNLVVPVGKLKLVAYDERENSSSKGKVIELTLSKEEYFLTHIPAGVWYSFQAVSPEMAMIANCATIEHDPEEVVYRELGDANIPYQWA